MMWIRVLAATVILLASGAGCRTRNEHKGRFDGWDGGIPPLREECTPPAESCYESCKKRKASITCVGCCRDQRLLCDTKQPFDFMSCDTAQ